MHWDATPWAFYGIAWGVPKGDGMALCYVQSIGQLPICMLWNCKGASPGGCQGSALWVLQWDAPMGIPWNCIGNSPCESHGLVLWVMHWESPMGILWNCIGSSHGAWHGIVLCAIHWAFAQMHVMELQWCFSWWMPRKCSMGTSVGCPHGHPMELHWEFSM